MNKCPHCGTEGNMKDIDTLVYEMHCGGWDKNPVEDFVQQCRSCDTLLIKIPSTDPHDMAVKLNAWRRTE